MLRLTIKVFEVGQLDAFAHAEDVGGRAQTVYQHPHVPCIESGDFGGGFSTRMPVVVQRMLYVCPCGNDAGQDDESE